MESAAPDLVRLRARLEERFGSAILPAGLPAAPREARPGFRVPVATLDRLLPTGIPRGALSLWVGAGTSGRTAALRALVEHACASGAAAGVVDAGRALDAGFGLGAGGALEGLWVARPPAGGRAQEGAWAAEALLRSGAFDLVVLDGCLPDTAQAHRLRALAREREAALVVSIDAGDDGSPGWRADLRLNFERLPLQRGLMPGGRFRARTRLRGERTGGREGEVELVHEPADRLRSDLPFLDRRPPPR